MPRRLPTVCSDPGCPNVALRRGRCAAHARQVEREWEATRDQRGVLRGGRRVAWRKRALDAAGNRCQRCRRGPPTAELEVHHLGALHDHDNVAVLCVDCHAGQHRTTYDDAIL
jgi:hypothetical protein